MLLLTDHLEIPKLSEPPVPNLGEAVKGKTFNVQRKKPEGTKNRITEFQSLRGLSRWFRV